MFSPIVVPLDGSPESESALPLAAALAQRHHAPLELVRVDVPTPIYGMAPAPDLGLDIERARADLAALRATADALSAEHGLQVVPVQPRGEVVPALAAHLDGKRDALVVMTSHGRGGLSRLWLGSVTDALIRRVGQPVVVTPASARSTSFTPGEPMFRRILVPLDGSKFALFALDVALSFAFTADVEMHLVHVLEPIPSLEPFPDMAVALEGERVMQAADRRQAAVDDLERVGRSLDRPAGTVRTHAEISTRVASALLTYARANDIDLIAVATHSRGGIERAALGSVADKMLRGAEIPVVVCRPA